MGEVASVVGVAGGVVRGVVVVVVTGGVVVAGGVGALEDVTERIRV